jgi:hypothetical protein
LATDEGKRQEINDWLTGTQADATVHVSLSILTDTTRGSLRRSAHEKQAYIDLDNCLGENADIQQFTQNSSLYALFGHQQYKFLTGGVADLLLLTRGA